MGGNINEVITGEGKRRQVATKDKGVGIMSTQTIVVAKIRIVEEPGFRLTRRTTTRSWNQKIGERRRVQLTLGNPAY